MQEIVELGIKFASKSQKTSDFYRLLPLDFTLPKFSILYCQRQLESVCEDALFQELEWRGLQVKSQIYVPIKYKTVVLRKPLRLDLLVEDRIIVEVKATEINHSVYTAQVLTYLRLTNLKLGLVVNFGQERLIDGLDRVVNGL